MDEKNLETKICWEKLKKRAKAKSGRGLVKLSYVEIEFHVNGSEILEKLLSATRPHNKPTHGHLFIWAN